MTTTPIPFPAINALISDYFNDPDFLTYDDDNQKLASMTISEICDDTDNADRIAADHHLDADPFFDAILAHRDLIFDILLAYLDIIRPR